MQHNQGSGGHQGIVKLYILQLYQLQIYSFSIKVNVDFTSRNIKNPQSTIVDPFPSDCLPHLYIYYANSINNTISEILRHLIYCFEHEENAILTLHTGILHNYSNIMYVHTQ